MTSQSKDKKSSEPATTLEAESMDIPVHISLDIASFPAVIDLPTKPAEQLNWEERTSCTKEEVLAKLIGWRQGPILGPFATVHLTSLNGSLQQQLKAVCDAAQWKAIADASADKDTFSAMLQDDAKLDAASRNFLEKQSAANIVRTIMKKAESYLLDIDDELEKKSKSALRSDQTATESSGVIHLTLRSVERWAQKMYGISVAEPSRSKMRAGGPANQPQPRPEATPKSSDDVLITLAFLTEQFAASWQGDPSLQHDSGAPNYLAIAKHLQAVADASLGWEFPGQEVDKIRRRLMDAVGAKDSWIRQEKREKIKKEL